MTETIFEGITQHDVQTPRLRASVLERPLSSLQKTVVFIHGNVSSSLFWQPTMLALPDDVLALAIDLRGFGNSETLPVDATRGFGGTAGPEGRMLNADGAGTGGGGADPDFVARLGAHDTSGNAQTSPRAVYRSTYVKNGEGLPYEDIWVESMLSTSTSEGNYPGDSTESDNWPGFAPGRVGVLNTMSPVYFNVSRIADVAAKPPILWIHGTDDAIASDNSIYDLNYLGQLGAIPGWPGAETAPPQPMKEQTRAVLDRYQANGGDYREVELADCGHSPHLEHPRAFSEAFHAHIA